MERLVRCSRLQISCVEPFILNQTNLGLEPLRKGPPMREAQPPFQPDRKRSSLCSRVGELGKPTLEHERHLKRARQKLADLDEPKDRGSWEWLRISPPPMQVRVSEEGPDQ